MRIYANVMLGGVRSGKYSSRLICLAVTLWYRYSVYSAQCCHNGQLFFYYLLEDGCPLTNCKDILMSILLHLLKVNVS